MKGLTNLGGLDQSPIQKCRQMCSGSEWVLEDHKLPLSLEKEMSEITCMEKRQELSKRGQKQGNETGTENMDTFFKTN